MTRRKNSFILLLMVLVLGACRREEPSTCPLPPPEFSEADLIGTWSAIGSQGNNTILISADGQYRQFMSVQRTGFKYESSWLPWRITYSDQGLPYLHLKGLLMCAYWDQMDCTGETGIEPFTPGDTKDPFANTTYWYDGCQKKWIDTPGEAVFMIFGVQSTFIMPSRGIMLVPFTKNPDGASGPAFQLREPISQTNSLESLKTPTAESPAESELTSEPTY